MFWTLVGGIDEEEGEHEDENWAVLYPGISLLSPHLPIRLMVVYSNGGGKGHIFRSRHESMHLEQRVDAMVAYLVCVLS